MKPRHICLLSGILGASGILIGAFGAHALPRLLADLDATALVEREEWLHTGVTYHMHHVVALLVLGLTAQHAGGWKEGADYRGPAKAFLLGILLFSGSLYLMTLTGIRKLGAVVPLGGVSFVLGWTLLAWSAYRQGRNAP